MPKAIWLSCDINELPVRLSSIVRCEFCGNRQHFSNRNMAKYAHGGLQ